MIYDGWQADYERMISLALTQTQPENITLGMLRLLPGHLHLLRQTAADPVGSCLDRLTESAADGKLRFSVAERISFYYHLIKMIHFLGRQISISLCRETAPGWNPLAEKLSPRQGNCITW